MAVMNAYPSRAQQEHAVRQVTELLREAGHSDDPQQLVTTMRTEADRQHAVAVAVGNESPLAHRIGAALRKAGKIDAPTLLHRTAQILRTDKPERWLDRWGDGSVRGVDIAKVLKTAWEQLDGERKVDAEDLPGRGHARGRTQQHAPQREPRGRELHLLRVDDEPVQHHRGDDRARRDRSRGHMPKGPRTARTRRLRAHAVEATCPRGRERRERAGFVLTLREPELRKATTLLREQIQEKAAKQDATRVSEAAAKLLAELDKLQGAIGNIEPESAKEDAA